MGTDGYSTRSGRVLATQEGAQHRALYKAMGYTADELKRPLIGVANAWSTVCPGHFNLRMVAEAVRAGIYMEGGTPVEFGTIAACDGIACHDFGLPYILPTREVIADGIELMLQAHLLDGVVLLSSCDKTVPGMIMGALRADVPTLMVHGGPMASGELRGKSVDVSEVFVAHAAVEAGGLARDEYEQLEDLTCPTWGSCSELGTANSMCCISEALGLALPGTSTIPSTAAARLRAAKLAGRRVVQMVREGLTCRRIVSRGALENAARVASAIGASTNCAIHLLAVAVEAGVDYDLAALGDAFWSVPTLASIRPSGEHDLAQFHAAGGVPAVMKRIAHALDPRAFTASGLTVGELVEGTPEASSAEVIRELSSPYRSHGGLRVLTGNLAPDGAIGKPSAVPSHMLTFRGPARTYDSQEDAVKALARGDVASGDALVVRYQGPIGGPGMPEMVRLLKFIHGMGLGREVALLTDGRLSGSNEGCFVCHICPEAAAAGPLAAVRDGDGITIDFLSGRVDIEVPRRELEGRLARVRSQEAAAPRSSTARHGALGHYVTCVDTASRGAVRRRHSDGPGARMEDPANQGGPVASRSKEGIDQHGQDRSGSDSGWHQG